MLIFFGGSVAFGVSAIWWVLIFRQLVRRRTDEMGRQLEREGAFSQLGTELNSANDITTAARVILATADKLLPWDAASIDLYDPARDQFDPVLCVDTIEGKRQEVPHGHNGRKPGMLHRQVIDGHSQLILHPPAALKPPPGDLVPFGDITRPSASLMFVPIRDGLKVIGILSLHSYQKLAFGQSSLHTLQFLADHCGGAIDRIRGRTLLQEAFVGLENRVTERTVELSDSNRLLQVEIEERARIDSELAHERHLLRAIMDTLPDFIYFKDRDSRFVRVNQSLLVKLGFRDAREIEGKDDHDLYPEEFARSTRADEEEILRTGQPLTGKEERLILPDGGQIWILTTKMPWNDPAGHVIGTFGLGRDITKRKLAEQALKKQQDEYQTIFDSVPAMVIYKDTRNNIVRMNRYATGLHGAGRESLEGRSVFDLSPEFAQTYYESDLEVIKSGQPKLGIIEPVITASGARRWLQADKIPYRDADGAIIGVIVFAVDISDRKVAEEALMKAQADLERRVEDRTRELSEANVQLKEEIAERELAEQAMRQSEERFARAFHGSPVAMGITHYEDGRFIDANESLLVLLQYRREEVIGRTAVGLGVWVHPEERAELVERIRRDENVRDSEFQFRTKAGEIRTVLLSVERIELGDEPCLLFITHDITTRLSLEAQLRHAQKLEAVGQLAAGVAHDFNNILTVIQGHTSLLVAAGNLDARASNSLGQIATAAERAANLTRQLLAFSRKQVMQPKPMDLSEVVNMAAKMLQRLIGENISMHLNYTPQVARVHGDAGMLEQVVINLAVNARDAMPRGGSLTISTGVEQIGIPQSRRHAEARPGSFVCLSVADSGTGIAASDLPRIFEPFFTTKEVGKGTGLGLATVYGIVKQHQGWVEVASELGVGTTFRVYLPVSTSPLTKPSDNTLAPKVRGGPETILVVEDEPDLRALVQDVLKHYGYDILQASNGREARDLVRSHRGQIDLLLTDMVMPEGISGWELAEEFKVLRPNAKVIFTSGYSVELLGNNSELRDEINFVPKPYQPQKLAKAVRDCLDG